MIIKVRENLLKMKIYEDIITAEQIVKEAEELVKEEIAKENKEAEKEFEKIRNKMIE